MRLGNAIREIRQYEKSYKRSFIAHKLGISERAYANIENNITDITLNRLEQIAIIFDCTVHYILNYKEFKTDRNNHYPEINEEYSIIQTNHKNDINETSKIETLLKDLLNSERKRISLLEALLRSHNIDF